MRQQRGLHMLFAAAVAVAAVGLISGVESSGREVASYRRVEAPSPDVVEARSYRDMRAKQYGPNAALPAAWWRELAAKDAAAELPRAGTPAERAAALAERDGRRAYEGAPPTIPHAVDQLAAPACLTCHDRGLAIAGKHAPPMSHTPQASCLQCHVVAVDPRIAAPAVAAPETSFVGLRRAGGGAQAWTGAPPVIPHPTWMRERCESCHGPRGRQGLRTPHPGQQSCQQCHAPSATFDQRSAGRRGATP
ncbi:MAG: nitrate reductase cytochrome c-type subunit [Myxococcales bacterium]|nr:nitrate reductase cytochrome c-type subunit [Myxococcales bacterium]MBK7195412.1 nitrate reductase cytochrome c-type subunit [Myxococcales bacterium]MBP6847191.1 nitrate reductase cytochrome c-type subunit [Kofleriaceae bacterium]